MQCRHRRERVETSGIRDWLKTQTRVHYAAITRMTQLSLNYQRKISDKDNGVSLLCNEPLFFPFCVLSCSLHFGDMHFSTCIYNEQETSAASPTVVAAHMAWKAVQPMVWPGSPKLPQTEDPRVNLPISPRKKRLSFPLFPYWNRLGPVDSTLCTALNCILINFIISMLV